MDLGQAVYVLSRLILGALASFLAIILWSRTRDVAWMLVIIGTITAYLGTIFDIMSQFGIAGGGSLAIGSLPLMSILLPSLQTVFIIAAFLVMLARKYRHRTGMGRQRVEKT